MFERFQKRLIGRSDAILFAAAWAKGQRLRDAVEELCKGFFEEMVTLGIGVESAPSLGAYTPVWEPLSDSWVERKGHEDFYFDTGALDVALRRKTTSTIFGRPQVFLNVNDQQIKITASPAPKKYDSATISKYAFTVVPFPKAGDLTHAEELVADPESKTYFKLVNPKGNEFRPLVSPFLQWYADVKVRKALKGLLK